MASLDLLGRLAVDELPSGAFVVSATGCLDGRTASELRDALLPLASAGTVLVVLDLSDAHGVDEGILAVIEEAARLIRRQGGYLLIVCTSRALGDRIRAFGLADIVRIHKALGEVEA